MPWLRAPADYPTAARAWLRKADGREFFVTTILYADREEDIEAATVRGEDLWIPIGEFGRAAGWKLEPQGACQGDVCVPLPGESESAWVDSELFNLSAFARHLGQQIAHEGESVFAFSELAARRREVVETMEAPDFTLPDLEGRLHSLSDYCGKKILLYAWASW